MSATRISCDAAPVDAFLVALLEHLSDVPLEVGGRFVRRFEALAEPFGLDMDRSTATGAWDVRVVLQPSEALLELVRALRAGEFDVG